ncbi:hypothetical protein ECHLIB_0153 [Ehrlichia chaffeensis str. Liberty]|nr:hypothetical protein ECHLIB_0153 [Ehrlichia chaffeensis str. Liberty]AHX10871.1 hypothetical protein ECHWP_0151 [Ehrlichia chaffeensis str. West Paces]
MGIIEVYIFSDRSNFTSYVKSYRLVIACNMEIGCDYMRCNK